MLNSIKIQGFRKYDEIEINDFGQVNFILGTNNVGKTTVLEAIYAWACGQNINPFINIPLARARYSGIQNPYWVMEEILSLVRNHTAIPFKFSISGVYDGEEVCFNHSVYPSELLSDYDSSYRISTDHLVPRSNALQPKDNTPVISGISGLLQLTQPVIVAKWDVEYKDDVVSDYITTPSTTVSKMKPFLLGKYIDLLSHTSVNENIQMYSSLKRENKLDEVTSEINKIFPEIKGFDTIPYPDGSQAPISVIKSDGTLLPIYTCGDGVQRWFYMLGAMSLYKSAVICIDEIDTGFHPDAQYEFCKNLVQSARNNNVQLFITTHNIEFIDKFLDSNSQLEDEYLEMARVITLKSINGSVKVRTMKASDAAKARDEYRMELR